MHRVERDREAGYGGGIDRSVATPGALLAGRWRVAGTVGEVPGGALLNAVDERLRKRVRLVVVPGAFRPVAAHPALPRPLDEATVLGHAGAAVALAAFPFWDGAPLALPNRPLADDREVRAFVARAVRTLDVLDHLHRSWGRAHGHLSLSSFWRTPDGAWTLLDAGTVGPPDPRFSSPDDDPGDPRSDLYALAAVLYATATGSLPFGSGEGAPVAHRLLPPPVTDALPAPVLDVLRTALQKAPHHRFSSAGRMRAAFQQALGALDGAAADALDAPERVPVAWSEATLEPPPVRRAVRRREPGGSSLLAFAALAFLSAFAWLGLAGLFLALGRML